MTEELHTMLADNKFRKNTVSLYEYKCGDKSLFYLHVFMPPRPSINSPEEDLDHARKVVRINEFVNILRTELASRKFSDSAEAARIADVNHMENPRAYGRGGHMFIGIEPPSNLSNTDIIQQFNQACEASFRAYSEKHPSRDAKTRRIEAAITEQLAMSSLPSSEQDQLAAKITDAVISALKLNRTR